jgi:hypothetical protein
MLILLFLACVDPDFGHLGEALESYEDGRVALATGAPQVAAEAFSRAVSLDSEREVLVGWEARALRAAGAHAQALSRLNAGVKRFPNTAILRFERAKVRVHQGDLAGAAGDLRWLYANESVNPIEVGENPEFRAMRADSAYMDLVPLAVVEASVTAEEGSVLVGERIVVEFRITSRTGVPLTIESAPDAQESLLALRIVEDIISEGEIWTDRRLHVEGLVTTAGKTVVGPWVVRAGQSSALTGRVVVDAIALEGARLGRPASLVSLPLLVPSTRFDPDQVPFLGTGIEGTWAVMSAGMHLSPTTLMVGPRLELRREGQPVWTALIITDDPRAEIRSGGSVVLARR